MSTTAILVCAGAGVEPSDDATTAVVEDLCSAPARAAQALSDLGATRAVLGLCRQSRAPHELLGALRGVGAEAFGIEAVALDGAQDPDRLLAAAAAKLARLPSDEPGRPTLSTRPLNRRALFSRTALLDYSPVAVVEQTACVGSARCGVCGGACPARAIEPGDGYPQVAVSVCNGCAACIRRCPTGAIHLSGASTEQTASQLEPLLEFVDGVVLACANAEAAAAPEGWARVTLPSLAVVTLGWILQIRTRGRQVQLAGCGGACCAGAVATDELARRILGERQWPVPADATPLRLKEPAATVAAYERIDDSSAAAAIEADESPLGLLTVTPDLCTLCGVCATSCPTGALRLDESGDQTTLRYEHGACTGCERCVGLCPESALHVRRAIQPSLLGQGGIALVSAAHETCERCGAPLPPAPLRRRLGRLLPDVGGSTESMCAACAKRASVAASDHLQTEERAEDAEDES